MALAQLVTSDLLFSIFPKQKLFLAKRQKFRVFLDFVFQKNTIKIGFFLKGSSSQHHPKTCFTNWQLVSLKNVYFKKISVFLVPFLPSNHYFCKAKSFLEKVRDFVPGFLGETLIGQKWCTLLVHNLNRTKKKKEKKSSETTIFLQ